MSTPGYWRNFQTENRRATLNDYGVINKVWYLFPQGGGPRGSFLTFTDLAPNLRSRDLIYLSGVLREQATAPQDIFDVTIVGAANRPRQATDGGVPTGGGASWLSPTSPVAATPLLTLREQGWVIQNIQFAPVAASACIRLARAETAALMDASHTIITGCYFVGGGATGIGIEDVGGCGFVVIDGCRFQAIADTAVKGISTGIAVPQGWEITDCQFRENLNDIKMSLNHSLIEMNRFYSAGSGSTNKVISTVALSGQGNNNHVILNQFKNIASEIQISNGYSGGSTDTWNNYAEGTAALIVTSPPGA